MNIKRTKISNVKLLYLIALLVATTISTTTVPISRASVAPSASGSTADSSASAAYVEHEENAQASSVDSQRAISLATSSPAFQARIAGKAYQFNSIYEEFSWSPTAATPHVVMNTVNVVYSHNDADETGTNVIAVEDTRLTRVVDVTVQRGMSTRSGTYYQPTWDGWEFSSPGNLFEASAQWTVTHAYVPLNTVTGENCGGNCDVATWVGLTQVRAGACGGSGCIVQGGTDSGQSCGWFGCGPNNGGYYYPWYEFVPAASVACGGVSGTNIHYGDTYSEDVYQNPGSTIYQISGNDHTTGYGCSAQGNYSYFSNQNNCYYYPVPCVNFAQVIAERPILGGNPEILPAFTQYTTSQCSIDQNINPSHYNTCNNIITNEYDMSNCAYSNIGHTEPGSSWTTTYNTSSCT